jgi:hypothetical protein
MPSPPKRGGFGRRALPECAMPRGVSKPFAATLPRNTRPACLDGQNGMTKAQGRPGPHRRYYFPAPGERAATTPTGWTEKLIGTPCALPQLRSPE